MDLPKILYTAYCDAVGGVAFNNDPLPDWESFKNDPAKQKQANAWVSTAAAAVSAMHSAVVSSSFVGRLSLECSELTEKVEKLRAFLGSDKFKTLEQEEQDRLSQQYAAMVEYNAILVDRLGYHIK